MSTTTRQTLRRAPGRDGAGIRPADPVAAWVPICTLEQILPDTGVAALVAGRQVAVFRLADDRVLAIDNHDPCSGANVLARGIVGDVDGEPVVASPVHKQRFALATGDGFDGHERVACHPVRVRHGHVEVGVDGPARLA